MLSKAILNRSSITVTSVALLGAMKSTISASCEEIKDPIIYQYKVCPFCHRSKAYLDYMKVRYKTVEVNPINKKQIAFSPDYKKVPVAIIDGKTVGGSMAIIESVNERLKAGPNKDEIKAVLADILTDDGDKWLEWSEKLGAYMYPNITNSIPQCWETFAYAMDTYTWAPWDRVIVRVGGTIAMMLTNGTVKKKYGIIDEKKELLNLLKEWTDAVGDKKFLHGEKITFPDIIVYGVIRSIQGLAPFEMIMSNNMQLCAWYNRVSEQVKSHEY